MTTTDWQLNGLVEVDSLKGELRKRKDKYVYKTIAKALEDSYKENGWEIVSRNQKTYRMKRLKAHDVFLRTGSGLYLQLSSLS
jgi:hypothetical protein